MSREGARDKTPKPPSAAGTPIWVWLVYAFGIFAAVIFALSILFTAGAPLLSDDVDQTVNVSIPAIVLWGGLMALAGGLWVWRRRQGRR